MNQAEELLKMEPAIKDAIKDHKRWDGFWYNGGTVASLGLSGFASIAAASKAADLAIPVAISAGLATFIIAVQRSLGFGARWKFHIEMQSAYRALLDGVVFCSAVPEQRREAFVNNWWARLVVLRAREAELPNTGGETKSTPQSSNPLPSTDPP